MKVKKEKFDQFKKALNEIGYAKATVNQYVSGAVQYMETGNALDKDAVNDYWEEQYRSGKAKKYSNSMRRVGTMAFIRFISGEPIKSQMKPNSFQGCDEDCFNCPYPDCYRPAHLIHETVLNGRVVNVYPE